ncbi:TetR/AcrR family transcriptional regulator [Mycobacterium sp. NPDC003323]
MPDTTANARDRMVAAAADMLARRGLTAMSVRELARHADAPLGSTYHYFPGGKPQVAAEAVRWADGQTAAVLAGALDAGPEAGLREYLNMWRTVLSDSDFQCGCAVLAVAVQQDCDDAARDAAVFAFSNWTAMLSAALRAHGMARPAAADMATLVVAAIEGAVAMCRAERSLQPLDVVGTQLETLLRP